MNKPISASAIVTSDSIVVIIKGTDFHEMIKENGDLEVMLLLKLATII